MNMTNNTRFKDLIEKTIDGQIDNLNEFTVYSFPQTWGSTCLGFGGIGGQAVTTAQTTVIILQSQTLGHHGWVFFNDRPAYHIEKPNISFYTDIREGAMKNVGSQNWYKR